MSGSAIGLSSGCTLTLVLMSDRSRRSLCLSMLFARRAAALMFKLRMRGNIEYVIAALWGLITVYIKQSDSDLPGPQTAAWVVGTGLVLGLQTVLLRRRYPGGATRRP